jgi:hypothetical protein
MSHIRVVICRVDNPATDQMTELAAFDLPTPDVATLEPTTALDNLETVTQQTGNAILRQLLQAQCDIIDAALVAEHRQHCSSQVVTADGHEMVTVASRFGILSLARQVCQQGDPVTHELPRRRAGWPKELNAAVDAALAREQIRPPEAVSWADWERVLAARRAEVTCSVVDLRHLGPGLESDQVLLTVDEVLTRRPQAGHFLELRTARLMMAAGYRHFSGVGLAFVEHLRVVVELALGVLGSLLLIADGARWIRNFFTEMLREVPQKVMILDWHHLRQRCLELGSRICRSKAAKAQLLQRLYRRLWRGDVAAAISVLEAHRCEARNEEKEVAHMSKKRTICWLLGGKRIAACNGVWQPVMLWPPYAP